MSCMYCDINGKCEMFDESIERNGVDESGYCVCEDDPDPSVTCEDYESIDGEEDDEDDI